VTHHALLPRFTLHPQAPLGPPVLGRDGTQDGLDYAKLLHYVSYKATLPVTCPADLLAGLKAPKKANTDNEIAIACIVHLKQSHGQVPEEIFCRLLCAAHPSIR
jgi:hypothetical protein